MPKNKMRTRSKPKPAPNMNHPFYKRFPLNLMEPSQELSRLRSELNTENLTDYERKQKELRAKVLERQLIIPNLEGGTRRKRTTRTRRASSKK